MLDFILDNKLEIVTVITSVVTAASLLLNALAPFTKNTMDDTLGSYARVALGALEKLALNVAKPQAPVAVPIAVPVAVISVDQK